MAQKSRKGKPVAQDAPRPNIQPAPDHGHDPSAVQPAEPAAAPVLPEEPPAAEKKSGAKVKLYPERITLEVTAEHYKALGSAVLEDKIKMAPRLRAMIDLWATNERFRHQVDRHARNMR